ncbi:ABC transporter ATP-binding protein [Limibacillus halophilus]|uniref:Putative spermidine/putrescine transport system ATP-binding protein n=1 Tax=Limibacillus halophilus TaxID=1579333 RepID=A0A839SMS6_9PROT|nr:ABC transporter ATP-binding protein [Limibacillus halophilus]MBB3063742.1 putative spermidine/putrescine transport system ATP-binding protein [Limibacillus halophilus]
MTSLQDQKKLEVRALRKTYGDFVALEGADLYLADGEFLTLLGPSGSGKTTLLLTIAGLNEPDGGEIRIDGQLATYLPPFKRDIGMVFQNYALFPHMTIFDNVAFALKMRKWPAAKIREAVEKVLEVVQLPHLASRYPRQLSGGQQQRIALARAMVYEPSVILMDEPLGALDKKLRDQLQLEIKRLHQEHNIAVLYVTHDQEEALVMSDRICLMRDGRIEQIGTPDDLYFRPQSVFAADFLGEANLLAGQVVGCDSERVAVELTDGTRVLGVSDHSLLKGQKVSVMVRPETVSLDVDVILDNRVEARVTDVIMTGGMTQTFCRAASGLEIIAKSLTSGPVGAQSGDRDVHLGWSAERAVVLPDN